MQTNKQPDIAMKVSAIVVTFNAEPWLDNCLGSLTKCSLVTEIIVVDNFSQDRTCDRICSDYPQVKLIKNNQNLGFGVANNIGIKTALKSGTDYIFLLNQDAWIQEETIGSLVASHRHNPQFGILSPLHLNGEGDQLDKLFFKYFLRSSRARHSLTRIMLSRSEPVIEVDFVNAALWLISQDCINSVGGFDPAFFLYGEDNDFINRARFHGYRVGIVPSAVGMHDREGRLSINNASNPSQALHRLQTKTLHRLCNINIEESQFQQIALGEYKRASIRMLAAIVIPRPKRFILYLRYLLSIRSLSIKAKKSRAKTQSGNGTFLDNEN